MRLVEIPGKRKNEPSDCVFQYVDMAGHMIEASVEAHSGTRRPGQDAESTIRRRINSLLLVFADELAILFAIFLSQAIAGAHDSFLSPLIVLVPILWLVEAPFTRIYPGWNMGVLEEITRQLSAITLTYLLFGIGLAFGAAEWSIDPSPIALALLFSVVFLPITRSIARNWLIRSGRYGLSAVVYGAGRTGRTLVRSLQSSPEFGITPVAFLDDHPALWGERFSSIPVVGDTNLILPEAEVAILTIPELEPDRLSLLLDGPLSWYPKLILLPHKQDGITPILHARDLEHPIDARDRSNLDARSSLLLKAVTDRMVTIILLAGLAICFLPALAWSAVRTGQRESARTGTMWRQMLAFGEAMIRVIRGRVMLVGPSIPLGRNLLVVLPASGHEDRYRTGIICPAAVLAESRTNPTYRSPVIFDRYYIQNWSVLLDLLIVGRFLLQIVRTLGK